MSSNNLVKISAAGAGKTWDICHEALETTSADNIKVLIITYTNRGAESIKREIKKQNYGVLSSKIVVKTWYEFLMSELIRPYQSSMRGIGINEIKSFDFSQMYGNVNYGKTGTKKRYITAKHAVRANEASDLALQLNNMCSGKTVSRLGKIYKKIYFDEIQDLSGSDIDILRLLCDSAIDVICCGDNKQATYSTHNARKNKRMTGSNIWVFFYEMERKGYIQTQKKLESRRFNSQICSFANRVFPEGDSISTIMEEKTEHDGVYLIKHADVPTYSDFFTPQVLRYDKKTSVDGYRSVNFGACKGETFDRVLIYPNKIFLDFIVKGKTITSPEKYYVAVTRPKYSVAVVLESFPAIEIPSFKKTEIVLGDNNIEAYIYEPETL